MKKLENKTVFITGGLSGIGKECAIEAAKEGANVAIADLKSDLTDITMAEIRNENSKAVFVECDVSVFAIERSINNLNLFIFP
jgi:NAD(P)-dependent dehydrogenase (short-subunit alcohol dehydrogenase family)